MGWIPPTTTFYYGQRSKCADLPELLQSYALFKRYFLTVPNIFPTSNNCTYNHTPVWRICQLIFLNILRKIIKKCIL